MLTPQQYRDIREAYAEIREPFQKLITQLCVLHNLTDLTDIKVLEEKIDQISNYINNKVREIRKSQFGQNFRRWAPIYMGGFIIILGNLASDNQIMHITTEALSVLFQIIQEFTKRPESEDNRIYRLIGGIQQHIIGDVSVNLLRKNPHVFSAF